MSWRKATVKLRNLNIRVGRSFDAFCVAWLVAWIAIGLPHLAFAGLEGERIIDGTAVFDRDGDLTTITNSDGAIIHYDQFDIGKDETVRFIQPNSQSAVLNRVYGEPSRIMGTLRSNGRVYLLNSAGLYFGGSAVIDVGGLYAVAGSMSNEDFLSNIDRFTHLTGTVENWGEIRGDVVGLIGRFVRNHGSIVAPDGLVAMVAGEEVAIGHLGGNILVSINSGSLDSSITEPGVENAGSIDAGAGRVILAAGDVYSLAVRHPGMTRARDILIEGGANGSIELAGVLDASALNVGQVGGNVHVLGETVALKGATIIADGEAGGGEVLLGGDYLGGGDVRTAEHTFISSDSTVSANATGDGDGGKIIAWSELATQVYGSIEARGGAHGGNGGFIETSSKIHLDVRGAYINASAPLGDAGTWLLDPRSIRIEDAADDFGAFDLGDPEIYTPQQTGDLTEVSIADRNTIEAALNAGTDVEISTQSDASVTQAGDITIADTITTDTTGGDGEATLMLDADGDIIVDAAVTVSDGILNLDFQADGDIVVNQDMSASAPAATLNVDLQADTDTDGSGSVAFNNDGVTTFGGITTSGGTFASSGVDLTMETLARIDTGGGTFALDHTGDATVLSAGSVVLETSDVDGDLDVTASTGSITDVNNNTAITVGGTARFATSEDAATADIDLGQSGGSGDLAITGAISLETNNAGADATIVNSTSVVLGSSDIDGNLDVTASTGSITDFDNNTAITVGGTARFVTSQNSAAADINLGEAGGTGDLAVTGAITLETNNAGADATIVNGASVVLATSDVEGDLDVTATTGSITDVDNDTEIAVGGTARFATLEDAATADIDIGEAGGGGDLSVDGTIALETNNAGADATIVNATEVVLASSDVDGNLNVTATTGGITDFDDDTAIAVGGNATFETSDADPLADINLGAEGGTGDVAIAGTVTMRTNDPGASGRIVNAMSVVLGDGTIIGNNLRIIAKTGSITDVDNNTAITVGGFAELTTSEDAAGAIIDVGEAGGLGDLSIAGTIQLQTNNAGADATIVNATGVVIEDDTNVGGNLDVTAMTGSITDVDNNTAITVGGTARFVTSEDAATADINLGQSGGSGDLAITGAISLETNNADADATIVNSTSVVLGSSDVDGDLDITATAGSITDVDNDTAIAVGGTASFATLEDAATADINVGEDGGAGDLAVVGTITLETNNAGADATIVNGTSVVLATSDIDGDLDVTASTGSITDVDNNTAITVGGTARFATLEDAATADIDLGQSGGSGDLAIAGAISLETNNAGADATIVHSTSVVLGSSDIDGNLDVTASTGSITDFDNNTAITVGGTARFVTSQDSAAADINLGEAGGTGDLAVTGAITLETNNAGADATIVNGASVVLATSDVEGDLDVTATTGSITDVDNDTTITVDGDARFATSEDAATADIDVGEAGGAGDLAVDGTITLETNNAGADATIVNATGVVLASSDIGGNLNVTATTEGITDVDNDTAISVGGNAAFETSDLTDITADINLGGEGGAGDLSIAGTVTMRTNNAGASGRIVNATSVVLGDGTNIGNNLRIIATTGSITDVDNDTAITVGGFAELATSEDAAGAIIDVGEAGGLGDLSIAGTIQLQTNNAGADATIVNATGVVIEDDTNVGGNLDVTAMTGSITDVDNNTAITVGGTARFVTSEDAATADINLGQSGGSGDLAITGAISLETNNAGADATIVNSTSVVLGSSDVDGNLDVTGTSVTLGAVDVGAQLTVIATTGGIDDTGTVVVGGAADFETEADNQTIVLDSTNTTAGDMTFTTAGTTGDVMVTGPTGLRIGASDINGNFTATASANDVAINGRVQVSGDVQITSDARNIAIADVTNAIDSNGGGSVTLDASSGSISIAGLADPDAEVRTTGNFVTLNARSIGSLTNSLDVEGPTTLNVNDTGSGDIFVTEVGGSSIATLNMTTSANNVGSTNVGYFTGAADVFTAQSGGGVTAVSTTPGGTATSVVNLTVADGTITSGGAIVIGDDASFTTTLDTADVLLTGLDVAGNVTVTTSGAGTDVTLVSTDDLSITDIVNEGNTVLSSPGNSIVVNNALGNGTAFGTFTVTAASIEIVDVTTTGLQTYNGDVTLDIADTTLTAMTGGTDAIAFNGDVDGDESLAIDAEGNVLFGGTIDELSGLTVDADGDVRFEGDIGAADRIGSLAVQVDPVSGGVIEFAKDVPGDASQEVRVDGDIMLNVAGRAVGTTAAENRATIARTVAGDLIIDSGSGDVAMGRGERMSVPGDLDIVADGRASIGDLTALNIDITANDVSVLLRDAGPVEFPGGTISDDDGVDIIGNTVAINIDSSGELLLDGSGIATFGVETRPSANNTDLSLPDADQINSSTGQGVFTVSAIKSSNTAITTAEILGGGSVLDGIAQGASQQVLFISGLIPQLPEPPEPPEVGPNPPKKEEVIAWLQCAQVEDGDEVPEGCLDAGAGQDVFRDSSALGALQLYRALVRSTVTIARIRPAFREAIGSYREGAGSDQALGEDFRNFLEQSTEHLAATDYLEQFSFLFGQLKLLNMLPNDYAALRDELLVEILAELQLSQFTDLQGLDKTFVPQDQSGQEGPTI